MCQDAIAEFVGHDFEGRGTVVEGWNEREYRRASVGCAIHVANVDFVQRRFADTQHEGTLLLEADISGALDERGGNAVCDPGQGAHATGNDDHGFGGIGAAGDVSADIGIRLLVNFAGWLFESRRQNLRDEVAAAGKAKLLSHDAQGTVGSNEVHMLYARVAFHSLQKASEEHRTAGPGGGDGQILRWKVRQSVAPMFELRA